MHLIKEFIKFLNNKIKKKEKEIAYTSKATCIKHLLYLLSSSLTISYLPIKP